MKLIFTIIFLMNFPIFGFSQSIIEWSNGYKLQLSDFQSTQTEINSNLNNYSIYSGAMMSFSFHMSTGEFMFTKNFNSKAKTIFNRDAAVIIAPDSIFSQQLVRFGQYSFDLTELYTRKFRKELYDQKGAFSDVSFFEPIYNHLQKEMAAESARVLKSTNIGENKELLEQEHEKVLKKIEEFSDFCFTCKPPKKEKKKTN